MQVFVAKSISINALQWTGTNGDTVLTNFGSYISFVEDLGNGKFALHLTDGGTLIIELFGWLYVDRGNKLRVVDKDTFYKTYDYVSG